MYTMHILVTSFLSQNRPIN